MRPLEECGTSLIDSTLTSQYDSLSGQHLVTFIHGTGFYVDLPVVGGIQQTRPKYISTNHLWK